MMIKARAAGPERRSRVERPAVRSPVGAVRAFTKKGEYNRSYPDFDRTAHE